MLRGAYEIRRTKVDGAKELTDREREILSLVNSGLSNQEIAGSLGLRIQAVKNHLGSIYEKLGVKAASGGQMKSSGGPLQPVSTQVPLIYFRR